jgi:hypothetical protein
MTIFEDNVATRTTANNVNNKKPYQGYTGLSKKCLNVRTAVQEGSISVEDINTHEQWADFLTKTLGGDKWRPSTQNLGYVSLAQ